MATSNDVDLDDPTWWEPLAAAAGDYNGQAMERFYNEAASLFFDEQLSKERFFQVCCLMWIRQEAETKGITTQSLWTRLRQAYRSGRQQGNSMVQWILPDLENPAAAGAAAAGIVGRNYLDLLEDDMKVRYILTNGNNSRYRGNGSINGNGDDDDEDTVKRMTYTACILEFWKDFYASCEATTTVNSDGNRSSKRRRMEDRKGYGGNTNGSSLHDFSVGVGFANLLKGQYKLPTIYLLIQLLREDQLHRQQQEQQQPQANSTWKLLRISSHEIPSIFKTFTEQDIQAGLALVGLQSLQVGQTMNGLTISSLLLEYFANSSSCGLSILPTIQNAVHLGPYTIRAVLCNQMMDRISEMTTNLNVDNDDRRNGATGVDADDEDLKGDAIVACLKCMDMEDPKRYMAKLQPLQPEKRVRNATSVAAAPEDVASPAYPILTHLQIQLEAQEAWRASELVREMENCSALSEDDKYRALMHIWQYLLDNGQLFLDNNTDVPEYYKKRDFLYKCMASGASKNAREAMIDFYVELAERIDESEEATHAEKNFVLLACQQTTLRLMLKACGLGRRTIEYFSTKIVWPNQRPWFNTKRSLDEWAASLLQQQNPIPESLLNAETKVVDLSKLLYGDEMTPGSVPIVDTDMLVADDDALPSHAEDATNETVIAATQLDEPTIQDNNDDFATYGPEAEAEETYDLELDGRTADERESTANFQEELQPEPDDPKEGDEEDYFEAQDEEKDIELAEAVIEEDGSDSDEGEEDSRDVVSINDDDENDDDSDAGAIDEGGVHPQSRDDAAYYEYYEDESDHIDEDVQDHDRRYDNCKSEQRPLSSGDDDDDVEEIAGDSSDSGAGEDTARGEPETIEINSDDEDDNGEDNDAVDEEEVGYEAVAASVNNDGQASKEAEDWDEDMRREVGEEYDARPVDHEDEDEEEEEEDEDVYDEPAKDAKPPNDFASAEQKDAENADVDAQVHTATAAMVLQQESDRKCDNGCRYAKPSATEADPLEVPTAAFGAPKENPAADCDEDVEMADSDATDVEEEHVEEARKSETAEAVGGNFGATTDEEANNRAKANRAADADRRADVLRASKVGYASQLEDGYEPEDTHGYTEEEASEAIHTEDEQEERSLSKFFQTRPENDNPSYQVLDVKPAPRNVPHSSDDMDMADEHTEHEDVDLGAESSELEDILEGAHTNRSQHLQSTVVLPPVPLGRDPITLQEYAQSAQQQHDWTRPTIAAATEKLEKESDAAIDLEKADSEDNQLECKVPEKNVASAFDADDEKDATEGSIKSNLETEEETANVETFDEAENEDLMAEPETTSDGTLINHSQDPNPNPNIADELVGPEQEVTNQLQEDRSSLTANTGTEKDPLTNTEASIKYANNSPRMTVNLLGVDEGAKLDEIDVDPRKSDHMAHCESTVLDTKRFVEHAAKATEPTAPNGTDVEVPSEKTLPEDQKNEMGIDPDLEDDKNAEIVADTIEPSHKDVPEPESTKMVGGPDLAEDDKNAEIVADAIEPYVPEAESNEMDGGPNPAEDDENKEIVAEATEPAHKDVLDPELTEVGGGSDLAEGDENAEIVDEPNEAAEADLENYNVIEAAPAGGSDIAGDDAEMALEAPDNDALKAAGAEDPLEDDDDEESKDAAVRLPEANDTKEAKKDAADPSPMSPAVEPRITRGRAAAGESVASAATPASGQSSKESRALKRLKDFNSPPLKESGDGDGSVPRAVHLKRRRTTRSATSSGKAYSDDGDLSSVASNETSSRTSPRRSRRGKQSPATFTVNEVQVDNAQDGTVLPGLDDIAEEGGAVESEAKPVSTRRSTRSRKGKADDESTLSASSKATGLESSRPESGTVSKTRPKRRGRKAKESAETDVVENTVAPTSSDAVPEDKAKRSPRPAGRPPRAPKRVGKGKNGANLKSAADEKDRGDEDDESHSTRQTRGSSKKSNISKVKEADDKNDSDDGDGDEIDGSVATLNATRRTRNKAKQDAPTPQRQRPQRKKGKKDDDNDADSIVSGSTTRSLRSQTKTQAKPPETEGRVTRATRKKGKR